MKDQIWLNNVNKFIIFIIIQLYWFIIIPYYQNRFLTLKSQLMKKTLFQIPMHWYFIVKVILLSFIAHNSFSAVYYVSSNGADITENDGLSGAKAWKTLSYACTRVPQGPNEIRLGPGLFLETQSSMPKKGISIIGNGSSGSSATRIQASPNWVSTGIQIDGFEISQYIIGLSSRGIGDGSNITDLTISNIEFSSPSDKMIHGAMYFRDVNNININNLVIKNFRRNGIYLGFCKDVEIFKCDITNANLDLHVLDPAGNIGTRWVTNVKIHDINSVNNIKGNWGVGIRGGGSENVKIYNSKFSGEGFDIEFPFESEYGVEIYGCEFHSPLSIPKGGQGDNPNNHGFPYSFWIHDNYMTSSYTIEGPRNHLLLERNFIEINSTNGRIYSQFGGNTNGPIWIRHNVVVNVDRSFVWKGGGQLDSVYVYNNTVYLADAADRSAAILDSWDNMKNWKVANNIFIAAATNPRRLGGNSAYPTSPNRIDAFNNLTVNVTEVPTGNFVDQDPQLTLSGTKPFPYYAPKSLTSFVVDKGKDVGLPFLGKSPDIGAYEFATITKIENSLETDYVKIFPNPSENGIFNVSNTSSNSNYSINVYNSLGEKIRVYENSTVGNFDIDLTNESKGIYIAQFITIHGAKKEIKIIKQ